MKGLTFLNRIMVYIDGSESSIIAAQYAICLARRLEASLDAIYVVDEKNLENLLKARIFIPEEKLDYEHDLEEDGMRYLNYVRNQARMKGLEIDTILKKGIVHREVSNNVRDREIDLLVLGELDELTFRKDSFYDEKERILHQVKCSVLVVKDKDAVEKLFENLEP